MNEHRLKQIMCIEKTMQDLYGKDVEYTITWTSIEPNGNHLHRDKAKITIADDYISKTQGLFDDQDLTEEELDQIIKYFEEDLPGVQDAIKHLEEMEEKDKQKEAFKRAMSIVGLSDGW